MYNINVRLSTQSVKKAIRELKQYKKDIEIKACQLVKLLTSQGIRLAQLNASYMGVYDSGELVKGIIGQANSKVGVIKSTAPHAVFCEFGTGVVGTKSPHPAISLLGWRYDVNNHGELGWWYFDKKANKARWTKGMPSRPYMYETSELLKQFVIPLGKDAFK